MPTATMLARNLERLAKGVALFRGRLNGLAVDVRPGTTIHLPVAAHRAFWRGVHPDLASFEFLAGAFPSTGAFFDIGANIGLYSSTLNAMSGQGFKAVCFEPVPTTVRILRRTLAVNEVSARIEQVALSDEPGELLLSAFGDGANNFWVKNPSAAVPVSAVPKMRLDDWANVNPTVVPAAMKVDVEGHELSVLEGAQDMLRRHRPRMMIECHLASFPELGVSARRFEELLKSFGYGSITDSHGASPDLQTRRETLHLFCRP